MANERIGIRSGTLAAWTAAVTTPGTEFEIRNRELIYVEDLKEILVGDGVNDFAGLSRDRTISGTLDADSLIVQHKVAFNNALPETLTEGQMSWNPDEGTVEIGLNGGDVVLQIGQEQVYYVKNQTGETILNGTVVMAAGTLGNSGRILITKAIADGTFASKYIMGIVTEDILDGEDGYVTSFGKVRGIDTSAFLDGDILYADPAVPGGLTKVHPVAPNLKVSVAIVIKADPTNGTLFVRPTFAGNLNELTDVEIIGVTDRDVLRYNATNSRFERHDIYADITSEAILYAIALG